MLGNEDDHRKCLDLNSNCYRELDSGNGRLSKAAEEGWGESVTASQCRPNGERRRQRSPGVLTIRLPWCWYLDGNSPVTSGRCFVQMECEAILGRVAHGLVQVAHYAACPRSAGPSRLCLQGFFLLNIWLKLLVWKEGVSLSEIVRYMTRVSYRLVNSWT